VTEEERARRAALEVELQEERELRARVHRHLGMLATILVFVAIGVALYRIPAMFGPLFGEKGISPWEALGIGATAIPWVLGIFALGVIFSLGTTRLMTGLAWIVNRVRGGQRK
jgi:hypothetical protein